MADDIEEIRERKRRELLGEADEEDASTDERVAPEAPIQVEDGEHLRSLTEQYDVVLADFYADWCGPCRMMEPAVEQTARETPAAVAKVDIDRLQGLAAEYSVQGVPTLVAFSDGEPVTREVGARDADALASLVERVA